MKGDILTTSSGAAGAAWTPDVFASLSGAAVAFTVDPRPTAAGWGLAAAVSGSGAATVAPDGGITAAPVVSAAGAICSWAGGPPGGAAGLGTTSPRGSAGGLPAASF